MPVLLLYANAVQHWQYFSLQLHFLSFQISLQFKWWKLISSLKIKLRELRSRFVFTSASKTHCCIHWPWAQKQFARFWGGEKRKCAGLQSCVMLERINSFLEFAELRCPWERHLTANCTSRAAQWPAGSVCGCNNNNKKQSMKNIDTLKSRPFGFALSIISVFIWLLSQVNKNKSSIVQLRLSK